MISLCIHCLGINSYNLIAFLSLVLLYCCVAKRYRYRLRDEVVNERYLVEEVYDRELRLAEQYEREKSDEIIAIYAETVNAQRYQSIDSSTMRT